MVCQSFLIVSPELIHMPFGLWTQVWIQGSMH